MNRACENLHDRLVQRIADGDREAFETLYHAFKDGLYRHLLYLCGCSEMAADLYQETWLRFLSAVQKDGHSVKQVRPFLYRIGTNLYRDWLRRKTRRSATIHQGLEGVQAASPSHMDDESEPAEELQFLLLRLAPRQRQVFVLKVIDGFTHAEIAQMLGIAEGTSKALLHQAVKALRQFVIDGGENP